jgi:hypothetical protein
MCAHIYIIECTNQFVEIGYNSATSTITCVFLNELDTSEKSCSIRYGVCDQEKTEMATGNTTTGSVILDLDLTNTGSSSVYCYSVIARNRTHTVMVDGRIGRSYQGLIDPQRGERACNCHTEILPCVPSKIQIRQWFVTNYSNSCRLDCTMGMEDLYYI